MNDLPRTDFIKAATWHGSLDEANHLLELHPRLGVSDLHTAAITGNVSEVRRYLSEDPANATTVSEPYGGNALVYLCLSKYLRFYTSQQDRFLETARVLLDAGTDPNSGFWRNGEFETALYGAAGVAHNAALTNLLLQYGADPNDVEAVYHSPETHDNDALKALVETGKVTQENLVMMLLRKIDWHDPEGVRYLLQKGADPNGKWKNSWYPLDHALARSNALSIIQLLFDYGADPLLESDGMNAVIRAAREGRSDVLQLISHRGISVEFKGMDQLIAACTSGEATKVDAIMQGSPSLAKELQSIGGQLMARFCLNDNESGVRMLLYTGIDVNTPYDTGDGYFGIPEGSLPIHVAAWLNYPDIVQLLIEAGAFVDVPDKQGKTPLALAIKACTDSYWTGRRTPEAVKALLAVGASVKSIPFPTGYAEVDILLQDAIEDEK